MRIVRMAAIVALASATVTGATPAAEEGERLRVADSPEAVAPLEVGDRCPSVELRTVRGERVSLDAILGRQPVALIFYRGGW